MGYLLLFFFVLIVVGIIISVFNPGDSTNHQSLHSKKKNRVSDTENYYHNYQVARSQQNGTAEQFFLMGMMASASGQKYEREDLDEDEDYGDPDQYDDYENDEEVLL